MSRTNHHQDAIPYVCRCTHEWHAHDTGVGHCRAPRPSVIPWLSRCTCRGYVPRCRTHPKGSPKPCPTCDYAATLRGVTDARP